MRHLVVLLTALLLAPASARANPFNLPDNCIIEGSTRHGGMQPDYLVRADDRDLTRLMSYAEKIGGSSRLDFWQKVERIRTRVKNSMPHREYDDPTYLDLIKRYRERGKPIPMGQYCKYGVGVCRENAILLTMALNRAGISSKFVYARVQVGPDRAQAVMEDHGFAVVKHGGQRWVVDSYSPYFNGHRFNDLVRQSGPSSRAKLSPNVARPISGFRRVVELNSYPRIRPLKHAAASKRGAAPRPGKRRRR